MLKLRGVLILTGVCAVLYVGFYLFLTSIPTVTLDRDDRPKACASAETDWKDVQISDPRCQAILKGRYEAVY